ncbi:g9819 [Coccomyxa elongata]
MEHVPTSTPCTCRFLCWRLVVAVQACARCCLRFAGESGDIYAAPAPECGALKAALSATNGNAQASEPPITEGRADNADTKTEACPVCLGVLQCMDSGALPSPSSDVTTAVQHASGNPQPWIPVTTASIAAIAEAVKQEDHEFDSFWLDISLPGSTQVRQQAVWHWLRRDAAAAPALPGHSPSVDVTDLKAALRHTLGEPLAQQLCSRQDPDAELRIGLTFAHPATAAEADFLFGSNSKGRGAKRKRGPAHVQLGRSASDALAQAAAKMLEAKFGEEVRIPPLPPAQPAFVFVRAKREAVYVGGYYRKLQRDISHSPFIIDGVRLGRTSIQEELERVVLPHLRCDSSKFISAGREDMDVRMLGSGRPFVLEIANARARMPPPECFDSMAASLNESGVGVEVRKLQPVNRDTLKLIKAGEQEKQKSYLATCRLPCLVTPDVLDKINATENLVLQQRTPTRVEHRRAMLVRQKTIYSMSATPVPDDSHGLMLRLRTQAGTYIKEFVHSDEGRTTPHLSSILGCQEPAKILDLDVLEVHMDFV